MSDDRDAPAAGDAGGGLVQRLPKRHRVMQQARVLFGAETLVFCVVRDVSRDGAKIRLAHPVALPDTFELMIAAHDLRLYVVRLRWQRGDFAGVTFLRDAGAPAREPVDRP